MWRYFAITDKKFIIKDVTTEDKFKRLNANFTKWSNTLKQFVGKHPHHGSIIEMDVDERKT